MTLQYMCIAHFVIVRKKNYKFTHSKPTKQKQNDGKIMNTENPLPPSLTTVKCLQQVPSTASPKMPSTNAPNRFHLNQCPQQMTAGGDSNRYPKDDQNRQVLQQVPQINVQMCAPDKCVPQEIDALKQVPSNRCPQPGALSTSIPH